MRDSKQFKLRFLRWKNGEQVYKADRSLPKYKNGRTLKYNQEGDYYYGGKPFGITVTGHRKKPYWVSPKGAGNMTVMPGDPEMLFFAPIAAGAGIAASPAITSVLGSAASGINTVGDALAATAAGQRFTSGLNFAANAIGSNKAWPWINAGLTSAFGARGIDKVRRGNIHNVGDVVETGLDLLPLTQLARPIVNTAGRVVANAELYSATRNPVVPEGYTITTPKIRTRVGDVEIDNPQLAYRQGDKGIIDDFLSSGEVRTPDEDYALENLVTSKHGLTFDLGSRTFENPMFAQGRLWYGLPEKENAGLLVTAEPLGVANKNSRLLRSKMNGTFDLRHTDVGQAGRRVPLEEAQLSPSNTTAYSWKPGYGYRRAFAEETPAAEWTTPQITSENAASMTPEQWTAAQDAAIARGDMAEAQRLRDLHFKVQFPDNVIVTKEGEPIRLYHGTNHDRFNVFDRNKFGEHDNGSEGFGFYFSPNKNIAQASAISEPSEYYVYSRGLFNSSTGAPGEAEMIGTLTAREAKEHVVKSMDDLLNSEYYKQAYKNINNDKHTALNSKYDSKSFDADNLENAYEIVATKPNQIKSADAVTYDNNGVRIPLGSRDNFKLNDIRYSWLLPTIGAGTFFGLSNNNALGGK